MRFEVYKDKADGWRWRLRGDNRKIIAVSSESYKRKDDTLYSIDLVQRTTLRTEVHYLR